VDSEKFAPLTRDVTLREAFSTAVELLCQRTRREPREPLTASLGVVTILEFLNLL